MKKLILSVIVISFWGCATSSTKNKSETIRKTADTYGVLMSELGPAEYEGTKKTKVIFTHRMEVGSSEKYIYFFEGQKVRKEVPCYIELKDFTRSVRDIPRNSTFEVIRAQAEERMTSCPKNSGGRGCHAKKVSLELKSNDIARIVCSIDVVDETYNPEDMNGPTLEFLRKHSCGITYKPDDEENLRMCLLFDIVPIVEPLTNKMDRAPEKVFDIKASE